MTTPKIGDKAEVLYPPCKEEQFGIVNAGPYREIDKDWWSIRFEGRNVSYCLTTEDFKIID
jgi:hypothetical protein